MIPFFESFYDFLSPELGLCHHVTLTWHRPFLPVLTRMSVFALNTNTGGEPIRLGLLVPCGCSICVHARRQQKGTT